MPVELKPDEAPAATDAQSDGDSEVWIWKATDDDGLSDFMQFRCMTGVARFMSNILFSGRFPYSTESDILRHAVHRHIEWLKQHQGCPDAPSTILAKLNRMWEEEEVYVEFEETLKRAEALINHAIKNNMFRRARRMANDLLNEIHKMRDIECREHYEFQVRGKFSGLLR